MDDKLNEIIDKIGILYNDGKEMEAIKLSMVAKNCREFTFMSSSDKCKFLYRLAMNYSSNNNELALSTLIEALIYGRRSSNKDYYYRCKWMINVCKIELKLDDSDDIISDYVEIKNYYDSIGDESMVNMIRFNMALYVKDSQDIEFSFKKIVKNYKIKSSTQINFNYHSVLEEALCEVKEINPYSHKVCKTYLANNLELCI